VKPIETGRNPEYYRAGAHRFWASDSSCARPRVRIRTAPGDIVIELDPQEAPLTVLSFLVLVERGYFNGSRWHRVVPNFVLQDGESRGDGNGGPGYTIRDEINRLRYGRGTLGMALSGPDTGGSQFFITHSPQPHLDGGYTIFGRVVEGMQIADRVTLDDPIITIEVIR
jgi:cyclophilin family peptidyl-prolyl cis-trans isomerase